MNIEAGQITGKTKTVIIHTGFWLLYIGLEYLANYFHLRPGDHWQFIRSTFISLPILILPTYFIVLYAVPRFLAADKVISFTVILGIVALFVLYARVHWIGLISLIDYNDYFKPPVSKVLKNVIRDYSVIALAVCIYIINDWRAKKKIIQKLAEDKARIEIDLLKSQLHPHFLFNTLNNIYSLAIKGSEQTADSILKLSSLLDYLVYQTNKDRIAIRSEIELIRNYLELEKLRYGDTLQLQLEIQDQEDRVTAPPLILLPFVENCFKHGGKNASGNFEIRIDLKFESGVLYFKVVNSVRRDKTEKENNRTGIGLRNIRDRLNHHYPKAFTLQIDPGEEYFSIDLTINMK